FKKIYLVASDEVAPVAAGAAAASVPAAGAAAGAVAAGAAGAAASSCFLVQAETITAAANNAISFFILIFSSFLLPQEGTII
ncbi:MAG: hypothetical protein WCK43_01725, partial [bacterium]